MKKNSSIKFKIASLCSSLFLVKTPIKKKQLCTVKTPVYYIYSHVCIITYIIHAYMCNYMYYMFVYAKSKASKADGEGEITR